jgi:hypothetical protein
VSTTRADSQRSPMWAVAVTVVVGLIAAGASYGHQVSLALEAGEPKFIAHLIPLSVDGLAIAALWAGRRGRWWLVLALAASVAANVASAEPTPEGYAIGAWPPIALIGTHQLLHGRERQRPERRGPRSPAPERPPRSVPAKPTGQAPTRSGRAPAGGPLSPDALLGIARSEADRLSGTGRDLSGPALREAVRREGGQAGNDRIHEAVRAVKAERAASGNGSGGR